MGPSRCASIEEPSRGGDTETMWGVGSDSRMGMWRSLRLSVTAWLSSANSGQKDSIDF